MVGAPGRYSRRNGGLGARNLGCFGKSALSRRPPPPPSLFVNKGSQRSPGLPGESQAGHQGPPAPGWCGPRAARRGLGRTSAAPPSVRDLRRPLRSPDADERTSRPKLAAAAGPGCGSAPAQPRTLPARTQGPAANTARLACSAPRVFIAWVGRAPPPPAGPTSAKAPAQTRGPRSRSPRSPPS